MPIETQPSGLLCGGSGPGWRFGASSAKCDGRGAGPRPRRPPRDDLGRTRGPRVARIPAKPRTVVRPVRRERGPIRLAILEPHPCAGLAVGAEVVASADVLGSEPRVAAAIQPAMEAVRSGRCSGAAPTAAPCPAAVGTGAQFHTAVNRRHAHDYAWHAVPQCSEQVAGRERKGPHSRRHPRRDCTCAAWPGDRATQDSPRGDAYPRPQDFGVPRPGDPTGHNSRGAAERTWWSVGPSARRTSPRGAGRLPAGSAFPRLARQHGQPERTSAEHQDVQPGSRRPAARRSPGPRRQDAVFRPAQVGLGRAVDPWSCSRANPAWRAVPPLAAGRRCTAHGPVPA